MAFERIGVIGRRQLRGVDVLFSHEKDKWVVFSDSGRTLSTHRTKNAARSAATSRVRNSNTFQKVRILRKDGTLQNMIEP